ncbi:MAG TPA: tetratricopeptide repeat protein [Pyrinomonadaceae bacterium]|nr:tetratricopeptide repeat protein [Pyrinomonadaceae bacterium]
MRFPIAILILFLAFAAPVFSQTAEFQSLLEKARDGDRAAQNDVGIAYSEAQGVKPNQKKAVYWFRQSAEQGGVYGACNLGLHYRMGWGVDRNVTLMWKYVFAAHALDGLNCNPGDVPRKLRRPRSMERGWNLAVAWLRAHPDFKNHFGDQPWMSDKNEYPITVREYGVSIQLPYRETGKQTRRR